MSGPLVVLIIIVVVTLFAGIAYLSYLAEKKRREAFQALATSRGWTYTKRDDRWTQAFSGAPFGLGHNRQAHHILSGKHDGRDIVCFDFVYYTTSTTRDSNGNTSSHENSHWHSVIALSTVAGLPNLEVSPQGFFGRTVGRLFNTDIELESEEFNRAFGVSCDDRKFAFDILHPRLMEYLLTVRDVAWRLSEGHILTIDNGRADLADLDRRIAVVDRVLDSVPDFVRQQYGIPGTQELA